MTDKKAVISDYNDAPNFGIFHLAINQAAELLVLDMWCSGEIEDIPPPQDWDGDERDPRLKVALSNHVTAFEKRLSESISNGKLEAEIRLDFDDRLIPEKTFIDYDDLHDWLEVRGYTPGDIISDWVENEIEISTKARDEIGYLRVLSQNGKAALWGGNPENTIKELVIENQKLKERLSSLDHHTARTERPLTTRARRTLLTLIGALCKGNKIEWQERGAATKIKALTEMIGVMVDEETIRNILREIPDAIESRMK